MSHSHLHLSEESGRSKGGCHDYSPDRFKKCGSRRGSLMVSIGIFVGIAIIFLSARGCS